jgi:hypothetical protein
LPDDGHRQLPVAPARAHLLQLRTLGIPWKAMAAVAEVSTLTVRRIVDGRALRLHPQTAERILELDAVLQEDVTSDGQARQARASERSSSPTASTPPAAPVRERPLRCGLVKLR